MRRTLALGTVVGVLAGLVVAGVLPATPRRTASADVATTPCGTATTAPPATFSSVVWIVLSSKTFPQVVGNRTNAPYTNTLADNCGLATAYTTGLAASAPPLASYLAMTSGSPQGVTANNPPTSAGLAGPSLFAQLGTGGWTTLEQSMPVNCARADAKPYAVTRNPAAYFASARDDCATQDVPLGAMPSSFGAFTLLKPDLEHDMSPTAQHSSVAGQVGAGDTWLAGQLPLLLRSAQYQAGSMAIFVTWDKGSGTSTHVPTLVISPYTHAGTRGTDAYTHYSMLRTTEDLLGQPALGSAQTASSMAAEFGLVARPAGPAAPCGTAVSPAPAVFDHVVWVLLENKNDTDVLGNTADAPFLNSLARACGVATNLTAVNNSLPKIPLTSGNPWGITKNAPPSTLTLDHPSLFSQLAGGWHSYMESMPRNCSLTNTLEYAARHNPAAYYVSTGMRSECAVNDTALGTAPAPLDLSAPFTYVEANMEHSMHLTSINKTIRQQVRSGDAWAADQLPTILNSPEYQAGSTVVFITWDHSSSTGLTHPLPTIVLSPYTTPGTADGTAYTHYSLLRTTEELLGQGLLENAAGASSMLTGFGLAEPLP